MNFMYRIINFLLAGMFLLFAFVQVNDPDPVIWILIYGMMAVLCIMAIFAYYPRPILIGVAVLYTLYAMVYLPGVITWLGTEDKAALFDDVAKMEHVYIEEAREFLGLAICLVVLVFYIIRSRRRAS